ncbi:PREDICTED: F-box/FBD/LRR-repeat protein At1g13570-like [Nicotiana attenuata]|uniref:F-box/FBD/LRR-repeat protein At1g13570-like n=1 Tax=Nicotiana attenuata TaxID=49451 RepID=UPI000904EA43|nr:PREDICTED: F-box/FBD/LRR-repeat protein At1g13570-like [Nicotiana attenuata]
MAPVGRKNCVRTLPLDILGNLPDDVIDHILILMPLQDAVRTSILSRKWRYTCCRIPQLTLDRTLWKMHQPAYFETIIRHILNHHRGPVKHFTLLIPYPEQFSYFIQLLGFLIENGIEHLNIKFPYRTTPYKLPALFFKCVLLRHLSLEDCSINHPTAYTRFDRLLCLKLYNVTIEYTLFGTLISQCPLLEQLVLLLSDNQSGVIFIDAPKLKYLDFTGRVWAISLRNVPLLAQVSFAFRGGLVLEAIPDYTRVLESLSAVEHLHLDNHILKLMAAGAGDVPTNLPFLVGCVKNLYLSGLYLGELYYVACALSLMKSFPCLEHMEIKVESCCVPMARDNIDLEASFIKTTFINLRKIVIRRLRGISPHMQLLKLLVAKSPALAKITIEALTNVDYKVLRSAIENSEFRCASPVAEFVSKY